MKNPRTVQSPFKTAQSTIRDSPHTQLEESNISNNRTLQNKESIRARMKINQSHINITNQGQQIRKQIAKERNSAKGNNPNEFNPKKFVTKDLRETDIIDIKQVFDYYDSEQAGILSPNDLEQLLISFGYHPTKETLYEIFSEMDEDELGGITFEYFLAIIRQDQSKSEKKDTIRRIYRKYDKSNKGYITLQDLRQVVYKDLKEEIDEEVLAEIFRKTDSNQDGKMTFEDFYNVMTKKVAYLIIMSCIIQLTYRAKQSLSLNPTRQKPCKVVLPKLFAERQRANSFDQSIQHQKAVRISPKLSTQSPKIMAKAVKTDFNHLQLSICSKQTNFLKRQQNQSTTQRKLKQIPINQNDVCFTGFEIADIEYEDFTLEAYLKRQ
ncbi:unnamed protein product [Paramecium sonneborni]|uniref:Calmodulin n=1 Tax=Paramecium sonneborni TaxID=65129 RepID=A0A8S1PNE1_9CILI|nr:unnamed protein product [Paramecium sonneborni]